ncbi:membrane protein DedA with SNARE-associated domain/rhodanese-related sulfurtransferase [Paraburkholderia sp. GAS448]|uniref:VTT domain-containing protein n=1 Tax=Paraburkholderia sp. GAS448 TaxID=3035136 RepID=UPI003D1EBA87
MINIPSSAISTWGAAAVFLNVLLTRLGVPLPVIPVLLFAGSAIAGGLLSFWYVLLAAAGGALLGDGAWFTAGRVYGGQLIAALGRVSPFVESKVRKARSLFERFGVPLVSLSKFVPGLAFITPPLMGTTPVDPKIYLSWDLAGIAVWSTFWLLGGAAAESQFRMLESFARTHGGTLIDLLVAVSIAYLLFRLIRRWQFQRWLARARISPEQLQTMMRSASPPVILDARPEAVRNQQPRQIPGALPLDLGSPDRVNDALLAHDIVVYCVCPNDAAARDITEQMYRKGFKRIRALKGGLDAWQRRGYPVEPSWQPAGKPPGRVRGARPADESREEVTLRSFAPRQAKPRSVK